MRKIVTTALIAGVVVAGPFAGLAVAGPPIPEVPKSGCELAAALGFENVRECEDPDS